MPRVACLLFNQSQTRQPRALQCRKVTRWQKPWIAVATLQTASEDLKADPENADALTLTEQMFDRAARQAAASQGTQ